MSKFKDLLPAVSRHEFMAIVKEGKTMARTLLQTDLDMVDSAMGTMSLAIAMRRSSWLQVSGLPPAVQQTIQDMPFKGFGLFLEQTNSKFYSLKDSRATLKSLGLHALST